MEIKTINIDSEDVEVAIKVDPEYFEENLDLENTLELNIDELKDGDNDVFKSE